MKSKPPLCFSFFAFVAMKFHEKTSVSGYLLAENLQEHWKRKTEEEMNLDKVKQCNA